MLVKMYKSKRILVLFLLLSLFITGCEATQKKVGIMPVESSKTTNNSFMSLTIPVATQNTTVEQIKFTELITDIGEIIPISEQILSERYQVNNSIYITPVTLKMAYPTRSNKEYTFQKIAYYFQNKRVLADINLKYFHEPDYDIPFLTGPMEINSEDSSITFSVTNISTKSIALDKVDCGVIPKIKEHFVLVDEKEIPVTSSIFVKPNETIVQKITFERDETALSEITLRFYSDSLTPLKWFTLFSFSFTGSVEESYVKEYLK